MKLLRSALRSGTVAGLAMIPFAALFRWQGLRVNEYGRKTLEFVMGEIASPRREGLIFAQHLIISWIAAVPLILLLRGVADRRHRLLVGAAYGVGFYVLVNSLALPFVFGDPTPWRLGVLTVIPSLTIHLIFGLVVAVMVPTATR